MLKLVAVVVAALVCTAAAAHAQSYSPAAREVIARARSASGGAAWNALRGLHETGRVDGVRYEGWYDPLRYGARVETHEPAGRRVHAFNGAGDWQMMPSGQIIGADDRIAMARARTAAFLAVSGFFFPSRFAAEGVHLGVRHSEGRAFDVLRVRPLGGEPRELWFDRRTRLLTRIIDRTGAAPSTVEVSAYRRVGPLTLAHRYVTARGGGPRLQEREVERITLTPADRAKFSWGVPTPRASHQPGAK